MKKRILCCCLITVLLLCSCERGGTVVPDIEDTVTSASVTETSDTETEASVTETEASVTSESTSAETSEPVDISPLVEEMTVFYSAYGSGADERISTVLDEIRCEDPAAAGRWTEIMDLWENGSPDLTLNYDILPDGLPDTDELCLIVLGFELNPDGSLREELIERLRVARACSEQYPNALIICSGGATAYSDPDATEGDRMAEWLISNGVSEDRVISENRSLSTSQNAMYSYEILMRDHPQTDKIAIISGDYHIPMADLVFRAQSILLADDNGNEPFTVISNAASRTGRSPLPQLFTAGCLIELAGDTGTAFDIFFENYDTSEVLSS